MKLKKEKERPADRNLRELVQAAIYAELHPCQRKSGTTCPCGPCSARRVIKRLSTSVPTRIELEKLRKK